MSTRSLIKQLFFSLLFFAAAAFSVADEAGGGDIAEYAAVAGLIKTCEVCHGAEGVSSQQQFPILAGQEFYYLYVQLKDFKSGLRDDPIMSPLASALEKDQMKLLSQYFSEQSWPETNYFSNDASTRSGLTVITAGQCVACHLGAFHGNSRVPRLAGQHPEYLAKTMLDFKTKSRKNSPAKGSLMASFGDDEIIDVACYLSAMRE